MEAEALYPSLNLFAQNTAEDAVSDEQLALRAREQYKESGIPAITADDSVAPYLEPDERLLWTCDLAIVRRVDVDDEGRGVVTEQGSLYVTDHRLLHFGSRVQAVALLEIDELAMADDRILVTLVGSRGLTLDVDNPHQLRVLIAAAKAARRLNSEG